MSKLEKIKKLEELQFGELLRELRLDSMKTLRQFCLNNNLDAGNYSRLERGLFNPPNCRDHVEYYAETVGANKAHTDLLIKMAYEFHLCKLKDDFRIGNSIDRE